MEIGEEICVEGCECFRGGIFVCVLDFWTDSMGIHVYLFLFCILGDSCLFVLFCFVGDSCLFAFVVL